MRTSTEDVAVALANGYIGEVPIIPTVIADSIHLSLTGKRIRPEIVFYYGQRDAELDELFGYQEAP